MKDIPQNVSASTRSLNPHLYGCASKPDTAPNREIKEVVTNFVLCKTTDESKLNKTEKAFWHYLQVLNLVWIGCQNITLKLADDTRYTPDFSAVGFDGEFTFYETKGWMRDDANVKIKVAARQFRWAKFIVVKKTKNGWQFNDVKP